MSLAIFFKGGQFYARYFNRVFKNAVTTTNSTFGKSIEVYSRIIGRNSNRINQCAGYIADTTNRTTSSQRQRHSIYTAQPCGTTAGGIATTKKIRERMRVG